MSEQLANPIKQRHLEALRLPVTVIVDTELATLQEVPNMLSVPLLLDSQWVVPNGNWLTRIRHAMSNLRGMLEQHARERNAMLSVVNEILNETRLVSLDDIPPKTPVEEENNMPMWDDENDVPF